ncbi:hypothetical protein JD844_001688 [Phrynosoma platyrhinos]|uniref:Receptor ligand binding region domain-containing protein n=1 Tax=Phrynosoma platyrhinos TaxID=52577 RepID=A0ABQ7TAI0_PHRPL|nr:hypothetical protein JD844_001688 [Phrynosoma platyrhinos]
MFCGDGILLIRATPKNYQHVLSLEFAVKEINENPEILSNVSLGFEIYDSYTNAKVTHQNTLKLLSTTGRIIPNYKCDTKKNMIAVIGGLDSEISFHMATLLGIYKIPQIAYSILAPAINVKTEFPAFYRMVPNELHQYRGIVQLLLHFQWTWVGIVASDNDNGEIFVQTLTAMFFQKGICTAISEKTPAISQVMEMVQSFNSIRAKVTSLSNPQIKVIIVNAEPQTTTWLKWLIYFYSMAEDISFGKVWVMTAQWDFSSEIMQKGMDIQPFFGTLSFAIHSNEVLGFLKFLQMLHPGLHKGNSFLSIFWEQVFNCSLASSNEFSVNCTGQEKLESLPGILFEMSMTGKSYSIYNAVHAIARALQKTLKRKLRVLHSFLKTISFNNTAGDLVSFDENGELTAGFDIINWVTFPNQSFFSVKVGSILQSEELILKEEAITWHMMFNQLLISCGNASWLIPVALAIWSKKEQLFTPA